jgi:hypothetical protein
VLTLLNALDTAAAISVVAAPGVGEGYWAGGPSAILVDGSVWLAYRLRRPVHLGRGYANVVARSRDGLSFETVATVTAEQFDCASLERPALVRRPDGGWRLYVSCSTPGSKHWWVEALDADEPDQLPAGVRTQVLPGDATEAWKDVVVRAGDDGWQMWACRHPLDGGDDEADRMSTWYATSPDGLAWDMRAEALGPTADDWQARGTRVTHVEPVDGRWWALYDGRRSAAENWHERAGLAVGERPDELTATDGPVPAVTGRTLRYASVIAVDGGYRAYFEATAEDGSHDLRTVYVPRLSSASQSEYSASSRRHSSALSSAKRPTSCARASASRRGRGDAPRCSAASSGRCAVRQSFGCISEPPLAPARMVRRSTLFTGPSPAQRPTFASGSRSSTPVSTPTNAHSSSRVCRGASMSCR